MKDQAEKLEEMGIEAGLIKRASRTSDVTNLALSSSQARGLE
jgi:hypothetical protein